VVVVAGLIGVPAIGTSLNAETKTPAPTLTRVRVIYLREIDADEAMKLVRSQADVQREVSLRDRNVIVVAGTGTVLDRCESLLRERDAVVRVADPHEPVELEGRAAAGSLATRVFHVTGDDLQSVVVVLRGIYGIKQLSADPLDHVVSVHAPQRILDASEALLRELKLLAPAKSGVLRR
jgi:hypothetical protein